MILRKAKTILANEIASKFKVYIRAYQLARRRHLGEDHVATSRRSVAMVRSANNEEGPHCHHACNGESEESVSCVIAEGHETSEFLPCQCECHFDENVQNNSSSEIDIELVEESECTERTPLKHQSEPSNIPTAGACCDITSDTHSDTHPDTPSDTHSNSELRVTITTGELESPTGSTKSQDDVDLEIVLDQADEEQISC